MALVIVVVLEVVLVAGVVVTEVAAPAAVVAVVVVVVVAVVEVVVVVMVVVLAAAAVAAVVVVAVVVVVVVVIAVVVAVIAVVAVVVVVVVEVLVLGVIAPARWQMRACWVSASTALHQGHLTTRSSSIPLKCLPISTSDDAGMTRCESVGRDRGHAFVRARRCAVVPTPGKILYWALAKALVCLPPCRSSGHGRCAVSES